MEDNELKSLWKALDHKIQEATVLNLQSWTLNKQTLEYFRLHRVKSKLHSLYVFKKWTVFFGFLWILLLATLAIGNHFTNIYFTLSILAILIFNVFAVIVYIQHIVLLNKINFNENIIEVQQSLISLQTSTLRIVRLLWLQTPFYTTFFWSTNLINGNLLFWFISVPITFAFCVLAFWLYQNISLQNADKKWFRFLLGEKEWGSIQFAKKELEDLKEFGYGN